MMVRWLRRQGRVLIMMHSLLDAIVVCPAGVHQLESLECHAQCARYVIIYVYLFNINLVQECTQKI